MEKRKTEIDGRAVSYYEGGQGRPLLLVHGAGATARLWHRQFGPLSEGFRVLAPDLPGFGGSENSADIKSVRDYARFLSRFMSSLNIPRASVVGSSMGGWASVWLALDFPELLERLVLVSPAGVHRPEEPSMPVDEVLREIENYYKSITDGLVGVGPSEEMLKAIETLKGIDEAGGFVPDIEEHLGKIKSPALVIWGERDRVIPPSYADIFAEKIPGAQVKVMEGAGHLPYVERAEEFNKIVLEFLK